MELELALRPYIEFASLLIEILAIIIIVTSIVNGLLRYLLDIVGGGNRAQAYHFFKVRLGNGLLLGLEILVAADVIRTVALDPTLNNILVLGVLVVIRTFLSWSLVVEIEGRWPWQTKQPES